MAMNMNYPTRCEAEQILEGGVKLNPGPWREHSIIAAHCAERIAQKCGMDMERAYINSLLHDIGRRVGKCNIRHIFEGYDYMHGFGYDGVARICLTHSFATGKLSEYLGAHDVDDEKIAFITEFLKNIEFDDYDRLGQLCDYLSHPSGACIAEKRMVDVALRYGVNDDTIEKWRCVLGIKAHFDELAGVDIYKIIM